ncbi:MAG: cyclic pyranopterin monophosphate synthase MoaC [Desulfobacterales bacterium]|nr:cyclic pyranopterin monophosphate synthase MoaC [Desulfobacterales bacterium]
MADFSHIDSEGRIQMVDVTEKGATRRRAVARGQIAMKPETLAQILAGRTKKGNVLETARIAGIMAAKRTADLIPLCHPLRLTHVQIDFYPDEAAGAIDIEAAAQVLGGTGVEMEALTAVSVAALTIYDMCKAVDREMVLSDIRLMEKTGGKSGSFHR